MAGVKEQGIGVPLNAGRTAAMGGSNPDQFGAGIGRALMQVGDVAHRAEVRRVELETRQERESANAAAGVGYAELSGAIANDIAELRDNSPEDGAGHVEAVKTAASKRIEQYLTDIPDQRVRQRWQVQTAELMASTVSGEDGFARGKRKSAMISNVGRATDEWVRRGRTADPSTFAQSLPEALAATDATIDGFADHGQAVTEPLRREMKGKVVQGYLRGLSDKDPAAAAAILANGDGKGELVTEYLTGDQFDQLVRENGADLRAAAAAEARQLAAQRSQGKETIDLLQKRIADHDPTITDDDLQQAQTLATQLGFGKEVYDLAKARTLNLVDRQFRTSPAKEIGAALNELTAKIAHDGEKASPDDVITRDHLNTLYSQRLAEENGNPRLAAARQGVSFAPINWSDPASIRQGVTSARAGERATGQLALLAPDEEKDWQEELASGPQGKAAVIGRLRAVASFDPQAALRTARKLAPGDRTLRQALRLPSDAAEMVLRGDVARAALPNKVVGPDGKPGSLDTIAQQWFAAHVAPALSASNPEFVDDTLEAAKSIYADWRRRNGKAGGDEEFDAAQFGIAARVALGGRHGRGGVGTWPLGPKRSDGSAAPVLVPTGMTDHELERRLANPLVVAGTSAAPAGSVNGTPAFANGHPIGLGDLRRRFVPVATSDGIYRFRNGGQMVMTKAEPGRPSVPFQVDVRRIPAAAESTPRPHGQGGSRSAVPAVPQLPMPKVRGATWGGR